MIVHRMEQGSPEWYEIRRGKMTASRAQAIGNNGKGLETYIFSLMAEKYSIGVQANVVTDDMARGNELEAQARDTYAIESGENVEQVGFVEVSPHVGCSPDGLIGATGGLEIKCPNDEKYFRILMDGWNVMDPKYVWQVQMSMLVTERKYWILAFFNPNFAKNLMTFEFYPDKEKHEKLCEGFEKGAKLMDELDEKYKALTQQV